MLRELLAVAALAALQWALESLLLANGAAFCLIAAAAARLGLGPPCIVCARVHRLLGSSSSPAGGGGQERDGLCHLLCDVHLAAVGSAPSDHGDGDADDRDKVSGLETQRVVSIGSEICEQDNGAEPPRAAHRSNIARAGSTDDGGDQLVSLFELALIVAHPRDNYVNDHATPEDLLTGDGDDERFTAGQLVSALREQRRELEAVRAELAIERRARAEAEEYQRQLEEQGDLDREAARLAMQLVHETETEKHGLQRQLDACRVRAQLYYEGQHAAGEEGEGGRQANGGGNDDNNYQSLVDFLPESVYSSSPDLANLLKLYNESGNGDRRQRDGYEPVVTVVDEEEEEVEAEVEEEVVVTVTDAGHESSRSLDATTDIVAESLQERSTENCHVETVTEAA